MTKVEQISREAASLSDYQLEAALHFIRSMKSEPYIYSAPPEAIASIERGLEQLDGGAYIDFDELSRRLDAATKPRSR